MYSVTRFRKLLPVFLFVLIPASTVAQDSGGGLPSIEDKTASMRAIDGFIPMHWETSTGKLWLEISRWDTDLLHMTGLASGLGSNDIGLDRGALAGSRLVRFHRVGPKVLMIQPNLDFRASSPNPREVRAVTDAFAPSTLWGFTAAAETDGRVLVDATDFVVRDMINWAQRLRPGTYRFDASRSAVHLPMTMGFPENTEIEASLTFVRQPGGGRRLRRFRRRGRRVRGGRERGFDRRGRDDPSPPLLRGIAGTGGIHAEGVRSEGRLRRHELRGLQRRRWARTCSSGSSGGTGSRSGTHRRP